MVISAVMLSVGEHWRRSLKIAALLLLLAAAELRLADSRPMRLNLLRRHLPPRTSIVSDRQHPGTVSSAPGRWMSPCAGASTADTPLYHSASADTSSIGVDEEDMTSQHGRRKLLRRLARQMSRLADRVDRLKLRYVSISSIH